MRKVISCLPFVFLISFTYVFCFSQFLVMRHIPDRCCWLESRSEKTERIIFYIIRWILSLRITECVAHVRSYLLSIVQVSLSWAWVSFLLIKFLIFKTLFPFRINLIILLPQKCKRERKVTLLQVLYVLLFEKNVAKKRKYLRTFAAL